MKKRSKRIIFYLVLIVLILIASVLAINFINKNSAGLTWGRKFPILTV